LKTPKEFVGKWRIVETEVWDREALDMLVPAHMTFETNRHARFEMICVVGEMDCEFGEDRVDFTWAGNDEMDEASGRGWALIEKDGTLRGRLAFHHGDKSSFVARREEKRVVDAKRSTAKRSRVRSGSR
jgi:hypothetical protein